MRVPRAKAGVRRVALGAPAFAHEGSADATWALQLIQKRCPQISDRQPGMPPISQRVRQL
jgi:hypothetical protein